MVKPLTLLTFVALALVHVEGARITALQSTIGIRRYGWTEDMLNVGDRVTVNGNPRRNPERKIALMDSLEKADDIELMPGQAKLVASLAQPTLEVTQKKAARLSTVLWNKSVASIQGHSIGRWEGEALVIDTISPTWHYPETSKLRAALPSSRPFTPLETMTSTPVASAMAGRRSSTCAIMLNAIVLFMLNPPERTGLLVAFCARST